MIHRMIPDILTACQINSELFRTVIIVKASNDR